MISRRWRGLAKTACAEAYVEHLQTDTFPAIRKLAGFIDASILRRLAPGGIEFLVVTRWSSLESIRAFAGADVESAVVPQAVRDMMVEFDRVVCHYEVVQ